MLLWCLLLLITCEHTTSYHFVINDNSTIRLYTPNTVHIVSANVSNPTSAFQYPYLFYVKGQVQGKYSVQTVYQYNVQTKETSTVASNLLSVSGLTVYYPTLYILEMGEYLVDKFSRLSAVSLTTGKQKVLLKIDGSSLEQPRALYFDPVSSSLLYSLSGGRVMGYDVNTGESNLVTSSYDIWAYGLCVRDGILYMYNSRTLIAHDLNTGTNSLEEDVEDWNALAVSGSTLCTLKDIEWSNDATMTVSTSNSTVEQVLESPSFPNLLNLIMFENSTTSAQPPYSATCLDCDVCLGSELLCECQFEFSDNGSCKSVPDKFLVLAQAETLSLVDLSQPDILHRLHINTEEWDGTASWRSPPKHWLMNDVVSPPAPKQWWINDVVLDSSTNTVFWIESTFGRNYIQDQSRIVKMKIGSSLPPEVIYHDPLIPVDGLAVNSADGLLYWLISKASLLVAAKVTCTVELCYRSTIVNRDLEEDTQKLEVSGDTGYMVYVSDVNKITRRDLDGSNPKVILSANVVKIGCIALSGQWVYILGHSEDDGKVWSLPLAGGDRYEIFKQKGELNPISMSMSGQNLFVLSELQSALTKVDLTAERSERITSDLKGVKRVASNTDFVLGHCSTDNGGCQHFCFSLPGNQHRCGCADGYILSSDELTCQEPPLIYISLGEYIQRFHTYPVSGTDERENIVHQVGANIVALDYFEEMECLVWIDSSSKTILKTYLSGVDIPENGVSGGTVLVQDGLVKPTDVSVDWISETVYWSDEIRDTINMVSLEGDLSKVLVKYAVNPTSLVVYPVTGTMFWIGWEPDSAVIRSAGMDGSNVTTLVTRLSTWPTDITIDYQNKRVVWIDARDKLVVSSSQDGTDIRYIFGSPRIRYPLAIAVWYKSTYWADLHMSAVMVAEGTNAFDTMVVEGRTVNVTDMVLSHADKQEEKSACYPGNGNCSHVCVPNSSTTRVCLCPLRTYLHEDGMTCRESPQRMIGVDLNPYLLAVASQPTRLSYQILEDAVKIAVHYEFQSIYWLDNNRSSIEMVHVNGTGYKTVYMGTFPATDIQVDWLGGNVYWTERVSNNLRCVTLDGQYSKLITSTSHPPTFLLLDPPRSTIFWMECDDDTGNGTLYRSDMSGTNITLVLNTTQCPDSMDIARETNTIYWNVADKLFVYHYLENKEVQERMLYFPTSRILWVEETLFLLRERTTGRQMFGLDMPFETVVDVRNTSCFVAFSPLDTGYSECQINNGGCTHFCFQEKWGVKCGCPAEHSLHDNQKTCTKSDVKCLKDVEFTCGSGECISRELVCSSGAECIDHSDEVDCGWCSSSQFSCGVKCIDSTSLCDGLLDCEEREDEDRCSRSNECNGYKCKGTGVCLPARMKCNGVRECEQGDDEKKCPRVAEKCNEMEWQCNNKECIKHTWKCDRNPDCSEGEDEAVEQGCEVCNTEQMFKCGEGDGVQCIDKNLVCDGFVHCKKDGLDEMNCHECKKGENKCNNGQCRAANRWCDRIPDCSDKSDEWNCTYTMVDPKARGKQNHIAPTLIIIFASLFMSVVVVGLLYKFNILPRVRSTYKQLTQSSNKTVETNVCVTTNTYSELETTVCSSDGAWQRRNNKSIDHYETITNSSVGSSLKPINTQNPYERFGIAPVQSTTDVSIADGPPPSIASGGYSSGPGASSRAPSRAPSARSHAHSARSRATSARSRVPVSYQYHVNNNVIWDDNINSVSDYDQNCLSDNYQSEFSVSYSTSRPERLARNLAPCGTPVTTDNDD